ncbi:MAG: 30S ribosomal protein S4 [Acidobacteria bacterium]|nr:30S ribosomal protein S4 [Acidobacteriota bacterium]
MARYREAVCRLCRREGQKLFLKGQRCLADKCAIEKRNFPPGEHGKARRPKPIGYGVQLREKQKVRRLYQILEDQFRNYFEKAASRKGVTGETLLMMLEQRLDNVVYRLGLASSRAEARQLVRHGHIDVSGRKVSIPSFQVVPGQTIAVRERSRNLQSIQKALDLAGNRGVPPWLAFDRENLKAQVVSVPKREDVSFPIQEQMIVELYSK